MLAILTRATASVVAPVLGEGEVRLAEPGEGAGALAAAARIPADPLLLDVATGPGLGPAMLRYRLARPQTREVLLALGRSPGDPEVAGVVQAGVYDVVTEAADLAAVLAGPPGDLAAGARRLDPDLTLGGVTAVPAGGRVVERRVAVGTHPVTAGLGGGVGTTTLACALAGYTARLGHETALVGIGEYGVLGLTEPGRWLPHLDAFPCAAGAGDVVRARRYPYVVVDAGVAPLGDSPGGGDERAERGAEAGGRRPSAIPGVGVAPDIVVLVCPAAVWRYGVVRDWLQRWPFATPLPARVVLNGVDNCTRKEVTDLIAGTCAERRCRSGPSTPSRSCGNPGPCRPATGRPTQRWTGWRAESSAPSYPTTASNGASGVSRRDRSRPVAGGACAATLWRWVEVSLRAAWFPVGGQHDERHGYILYAADDRCRMLPARSRLRGRMAVGDRCWRR